MSDEYDLIPIPVIEVNLSNPVPVIEVTIDKTGPQGPAGLDGTTADTEMITTHIADASDPHGVTLTQSTLAAKKATVAVIDGGSINSSQVLDFVNGGCYKCTATGNVTFTVSSLGVGQRASLHILAGSPAPTVSWTGVGAWLGAPPAFSVNKLTVVTLFNDGTRIVASSGKAI